MKSSKHRKAKLGGESLEKRSFFAVPPVPIQSGSIHVPIQIGILALRN